MERVRYEVRDRIGWIDLDDGKMNVMSPVMQADLHAALDRAETDDVVTVVRGRPGVFSAGFDLRLLRDGSATEASAMVQGGFRLAGRLLAHPRPVLMVSTGHAVAMGLFLLLCGDYRIAASTPARLSANEVAIGLTLPRSAEVILRHRLTPAAFERAALLAVTFDPQAAVEAGALDEVTDPGALDARVDELARQMAGLDVAAQRATKRRIRVGVVDALGAAMAADRAESEGRPATAAS
jgi:enoyl-CoA hydratase